MTCFYLIVIFVVKDDHASTINRLHQRPLYSLPKINIWLITSCFYFFFWKYV